MTTIKPPADVSSPTPAGGAEAVDEATGAAEFQALLDGPEAADAAGSAEGAAAAGPLAGEIGPLVEQVRAGTLSVDGAVHALIERALQGVGPALDAPGRSELESVLRHALESDPTLIALRNAASEP